MPSCNLTVTFVLWLFGGIFGLHHLYLNRPRQCFIWFVSWGGMIMGWLTEVTQLKEYVNEANQTVEYRKYIENIKKESPKPGISFGLVIAQFMIGHQLANLIICAIPEYFIFETFYGPYLAHMLAAFGASIGVHLVANMGPQKAPFLIPFLATLCTTPLAYFLHSRRPVAILLCVIFSAYFSSEYAEWCEKKKPTSWKCYAKTWLAVSLALITYASLWTSNMYFNTRVTTLNGTRLPLRIAAANFMKTQPWDEANDAIADLIPCLKMYGFEFCQNQFLSTLTELSDPERDGWAFSVLGFDRYPSQKQISKHCRKMSSTWHPDRFIKAGEEQKLNAEKKFVDIQKACGVLSKIKVNRERKNTWGMSATEPHETVTVSSDDETEYDVVDEENNDDDDDNEHDGDEEHNEYDDDEYDGDGDDEYDGDDETSYYSHETFNNDDKANADKADAYTHDDNNNKYCHGNDGHCKQNIENDPENDIEN